VRVEGLNISRILSLVGLVSVSLMACYAILEPEKGILLTGIPLLIFFFIKPVFALVAFVFLIPFEMSLIGSDDFISFLKIFGIVVAICYFVNRATSRRFPSFKEIPHVKLILVFLSLMLVSILFSTDKKLSLFQYLTYVQLFIFYVIIVDFVEDERKFKYLIGALLISGLINAIYSIHNFYFDSGTVFGNGVEREAGFLANANRFGYAEILIALLAFPFAINMKMKIVRFTYILTIAVVMFSALLSFSRGTFIALVATGVYVLMTMFKRKQIMIWLMGILIAMAIIAPGAVWERARTIVYPDEREGSWPTRYAFLIDGFKMGISNPLTGVGLGRFKEEFLKFSTKPVSPTSGGAHNMYISVMSENGIPVLAVFLLLLYRTIRRIRELGSSSSKKITPYAMSIELGMVFTLCAGFFGTIEYLKIFWLLLALANVTDKIGHSLDSNV